MVELTPSPAPNFEESLENRKHRRKSLEGTVSIYARNGFPRGNNFTRCRPRPRLPANARHVYAPRPPRGQTGLLMSRGCGWLWSEASTATWLWVVSPKATWLWDVAVVAVEPQPPQPGGCGWLLTAVGCGGGCEILKICVRLHSHVAVATAIWLWWL